MKTYDDELSAKHAWSSGVERRDEYLTLNVGTPHGFVAVYYQWGKCPLATFHFVHDARLYMRNVEGRKITERGLVRMASRFAREIAGRKS